MPKSPRRELARNPTARGTDAPFGTHLWEKTGQVVFPSPVLAVSGRFKDQCVFVGRGDKTFIRPYVVPRDPKTGFQLGWRERFLNVQKHWCKLTEEQRAAWGRYAEEHLFPERRGESIFRLGQNGYPKAQVMLQAWGLGLSDEAPTLPPPPAVLEIEEVASPVPGGLALRLRHTVTQVEGLRVVFEMTPATPTLNRKPRPGELTWAGPTDVESVTPLGEDGAVYLLPQMRHAVAPGERYGVQVRIVTAEGIAGPKVRADLIRLAPEPPPPGPEPGSPGPLGSTLAIRNILTPCADAPGHAQQRGPGRLGARKGSAASNPSRLAKRLAATKRPIVESFPRLKWLGRPWRLAAEPCRAPSRPGPSKCAQLVHTPGVDARALAGWTSGATPSTFATTFCVEK